MAFLSGDSFDFYDTAAITQWWTQIISGGAVSPSISANGRNSTNSMRWDASGTGDASGVSCTLAPSGATGIVQFAFRQSGSGFGGLGINSNLEPTRNTGASGSCQLLHVYHGATLHLVFRITTGGLIEVLRGDGTSLGTSSSGLTQDVYAYLALKWTIHNSTGIIAIKINGTTVLSLTGQDTQNGGSAAWDQLVFCHRANGASTIVQDIDDLMIMDGSGSAYNDIVTEHVGRWCPANAEGAHQDGTPSTGADLSDVVDESPANGDTDYYSQNTSGNKTSVTLSNWPSVGAVGPIIVKAQMRKEDAGAANVQLGVRVDAVDHHGATQGLSTSYAGYKQIFEQDPENLAAWQPGSPPEVIDHKET